MKDKEDMVTTIPHTRKGSTLHIRNVTGNIKIVGQRQTTDRSSINIEVTATAKAHDLLQIHATKGTVQIAGAEAPAPFEYNITVAIPGGVSVRLEDVSGTVSINDTVEILTVSGHRPCQIFTETLHDAVLYIGSNVDVKIKRLLGHCDIVADADAKIEVRDALISTLTANLDGDARVSMHGSARFAKLVVKRHAYFHIDTVELVERKKDQSATLDLGWINSSYRKVDEAQRRASLYKANAEAARFVQGLLPNATPPPVVVNA